MSVVVEDGWRSSFGRELWTYEGDCVHFDEEIIWSELW